MLSGSLTPAAPNPVAGKSLEKPATEFRRGTKCGTRFCITAQGWLRAKIFILCISPDLLIFSLLFFPSPIPRTPSARQAITTFTGRDAQPQPPPPKKSPSSHHHHHYLFATCTKSPIFSFPHGDKECVRFFAFPVSRKLHCIPPAREATYCSRTADPKLCRASPVAFSTFFFPGAHSDFNAATSCAKFNLICPSTCSCFLKLVQRRKFA